VSEDAAVGTPVTTVSAVDLDLGQNANVTYLLEMTSPDLGHFVIDKVTGVISLGRYVALTMMTVIAIKLDIFLFQYFVGPFGLCGLVRVDLLSDVSL